MRAAALAAAVLLAPGCTAFPGAANGGRRALVDGFVSITAPVQVVWMAGRDAWQHCSGEEGSSKLLLPVWFVAHSFEHAGISALHFLDLFASPIHVVAGNGPPRIYEPYEWPMPRVEEAPYGAEVGELALYGAAGVGGAIVAYWFATIYIPNLVSWFF
jgi:hypothetical protein